MLLLTGSRFNHSETQNLMRELDGASEKMVFTNMRDGTPSRGGELEVNYVKNGFGAERAKKLNKYGL